MTSIRNSKIFAVVAQVHWSFHVVLWQGTATKCTKIYNARAQLLFCSLNFLFGDVPVAVAVVVCLSSLNMDCLTPNSPIFLKFMDVPVIAIYNTLLPLCLSSTFLLFFFLSKQLQSSFLQYLNLNQFCTSEKEDDNDTVKKFELVAIIKPAKQATNQKNRQVACGLKIQEHIQPKQSMDLVSK